MQRKVDFSVFRETSEVEGEKKRFEGDEIDFMSFLGVFGNNVMVFVGFFNGLSYVNEYKIF